ncbi:MAG: hypothetical protein KatS3mg097_590 [Candidatus Parcubacteria bacterium]|nr:MAG: hypothetical protein KatS3mg097_590 [Candidatus Parcubacteria bacterium]
MIKDNNKSKIILCSPCCSNCPEVKIDGNYVIITDDNEKDKYGIREIKLTKDQFKLLLEKGRELL